MTPTHETALSIREHDARADDFLPLLSLSQAVERKDQINQFIGRVLNEDLDYGLIPGSKKKCLLKPGAEKLCSIFGLAPSYVKEVIVEDWTGKDHDGEPLFSYEYRCQLYRGGRFMGEAIGSCNSWESKYRYRWMPEESVKDRSDFNSLQKRGGTKTMFEPTFAIDKAETTGKYGKPAEYWDKWRAAAESGEAKRGTKKMGPKEFDGYYLTVDETQYRIPNPEVADIINTCQKMAQKRCIAGTVPVIFRTSRGVLRGDVANMYAIYLDGQQSLGLPGVDGSWRCVQAMTREEGREVVRIDLADGSYIRATLEHRFPTTRGLVSVMDLVVGDALLRSKINIPEPERPAMLDVGWAAGLFIADGHFGAGSNTSFTLNDTTKADAAERLTALADTVGSTWHIKPRGDDSHTVDVEIFGPAFKGLISQFVDGSSSYGKHLSRTAWRQGAVFLQAILDGYLAGDGSPTVRGGRSPFWRIGFTGQNRELANDLRAINAILGNRFSLKRGTSKLKGVEYPTFTGWIKPDVVTYNQKELGEIVSIKKEINPTAVYDIQVDGDHLYCLANGIQTHNSLVAACLVVTNCSDAFTQDLEDFEQPAHQVASVAKVLMAVDAMVPERHVPEQLVPVLDDIREDPKKIRRALSDMENHLVTRGGPDGLAEYNRLTGEFRKSVPKGKETFGNVRNLLIDMWEAGERMRTPVATEKVLTALDDVPY